MERPCAFRNTVWLEDEIKDDTKERILPMTIEGLVKIEIWKSYVQYYPSDAYPMAQW